MDGGTAAATAARPPYTRTVTTITTSSCPMDTDSNPADVCSVPAFPAVSLLAPGTGNVPFGKAPLCQPRPHNDAAMPMRPFLGTAPGLEAARTSQNAAAGQGLVIQGFQWQMYGPSPEVAPISQSFPDANCAPVPSAGYMLSPTSVPLSPGPFGDVGRFCVNDASVQSVFCSSGLGAPGGCDAQALPQLDASHAALPFVAPPGAQRSHSHSCSGGLHQRIADIGPAPLPPAAASAASAHDLGRAAAGAAGASTSATGGQLRGARRHQRNFSVDLTTTTSAAGAQSLMADLKRRPEPSSSDGGARIVSRSRAGSHGTDCRDSCPGSTVGTATALHPQSQPVTESLPPAVRSEGPQTANPWLVSPPEGWMRVQSCPDGAQWQTTCASLLPTEATRSEAPGISQWLNSAAEEALDSDEDDEDDDDPPACAPGRARGSGRGRKDGGAGARERARNGGNGKSERELAMLDPKRMRRILANRASAAKSKERKQQYTDQLSQILDKSNSDQEALDQRLKRLQADITGLLRLRLGLEQETAQLAAQLAVIRRGNETLAQQVGAATGRDPSQRLAAVAAAAAEVAALPVPDFEHVELEETLEAEDLEVLLEQRARMAALRRQHAPQPQQQVQGAAMDAAGELSARPHLQQQQPQAVQQPHPKPLKQEYMPPWRDGMKPQQSQRHRPSRLQGLAGGGGAGAGTGGFHRPTQSADAAMLTSIVSQLGPMGQVRPPRPPGLATAAQPLPPQRGALQTGISAPPGPHSTLGMASPGLGLGGGLGLGPTVPAVAAAESGSFSLSAPGPIDVAHHRAVAEAYLSASMVNGAMGQVGLAGDVAAAAAAAAAAGAVGSTPASASAAVADVVMAPCPEEAAVGFGLPASSAAGAPAGYIGPGMGAVMGGGGGGVVFGSFTAGVGLMGGGLLGALGASGASAGGLGGVQLTQPPPQPPQAQSQPQSAAASFPSRQVTTSLRGPAASDLWRPL